VKSLADRRLLLSVIIVSFLFILSSAVTRALRPLYFVEVGASPMQLGLIMAVPSMVSLLTRVPASTLANRLGRWRMMFFSISLSVVTTGLFAFVRDPVLFFPLVGAAALTWAVYSPVAVEYVSSQSTAATRGGTMGLYFTSIAAALFVGPLVASVLTVFFSLRQLFLFSVIFPVASLAVFLMMTRPSDLEGVSGDTGVLADDPPFSIGGSLSRILRNRIFASMCIARIAFSFSMGVFSIVYPVFASEGLGLTASAISLLFTFRGVTNMVIRIPAGRLSDRIGRRKPFIIAYAIVISAYAILAYAENFGLLVITMALFGVGWGMRIAPSMALVSESVGDEDRTLTLSVFMTMFDLGSMIGSLLVGFTGAFISPQTLLQICALVMTAGLFVSALFSRDIEPQAPSTAED
jgi:DHA1 family multidrug resistance protein-like MFS transporter